jgi:hypothetical protein
MPAAAIRAVPAAEVLPIDAISKRLVELANEQPVKRVPVRKETWSTKR